MRFATLVKGLVETRKMPQLPRNELESLQQQRLRKLLRHAFANSEFYHSTFSAAGITEQNIDSLPLSAFPTTDKDTLVAHYSEVLTDGDFTQEDLLNFCESGSEALFRGKWHVVHSSGSTGSPKYFVYDESAWQALILGAARGALWDMSMSEIAHMGISKVRLLYAGVSQGSFGSTLLMHEACSTIGAEQLALDISDPLDQWVDKVVNFKPNVIMGYPSAIKILADQLASENIRLPIEFVLSCGEGISAELRKVLSAFFQARIINFYAASESLALGVELNSEEGMYLFDDLNLIECIDGKVYLTCLYNFSQPLIRYYLSDLIELLPPSETAKYSFSRCHLRCGRDDDVLWFSDGKGHQNFIHAVHVENFCIAGLTDYQLIQTSETSFRIDAVVAQKDAANAIVSQLHRLTSDLLHDRCLGHVTFTVNCVNSIIPDPVTGKRRMCVSL